MKSYNHAFTIAFTVVSRHPEGEDITPSEYRQAILKRLASIDDRELLEAVGMPFDTYEE